MTLEEYLSSPQAVEDVRRLLTYWRESHPIGQSGDGALWESNGCGHRVLSLPEEGGGWRDWHILPAGVWTRVDYDDAGVCFRPDGDRFIVTDLGEAVRALRLRTGAMRPDVPLNVHAQVITAASLHLHDGELWGHVLAADLPRAIVALLLAAHRVASLEVPSP